MKPTYDYRGEQLTMREIAERAGLPLSTLHSRCERKGVTPQQAAEMGAKKPIPGSASTITASG